MWVPGRGIRPISLRRRAVLGFLRARARRDGLANGRSGAVAIIQRFGGALNLNVHIHALVIDGVFAHEGEGLRFHPACRLTRDDVAEVVAIGAQRINRLLQRRGLAVTSEESAAADTGADEAPALAGLAAASVQGRIALGPRGAGARVVRYGSPPEEAAPVTLGPCHANVGGFDLHGGIVVPAGQRERLERLCHYPLAWLAIVCAAILSAAGFPRLTFAWRFAGSMAALLLAPALVLAQLTVHNASAVLFPAWVPLGHSRPRGLDAIGQPLILFGAVVVTLAFMMIPGVLVSAILWFAFQPFLGAAVLIPCAIACLGLVAVEVIAATEVLGPAYEKMDLLSAERAE